MPVQPGIGAGEGALHELHPLRFVVEPQQQAQARADAALDHRGERELAAAAAEQQGHRGAGGEFLRGRARQLQADTVVGIVVHDPAQGAPVGQAQRHRQALADAMGTAHLLHFGGHRQRAADDEQVVQHPQRTDDHRAALVGRAVQEAPHREPEPGDVEQRQHQVGLGHLPVEAVAGLGAALLGDVELALGRAEQRHRGRPRDVPGQHGLVDLAPERPAPLPLDPRVGEVGVRHVRQHEQQDRHRRRVDDVDVQQQERQRCGQEHQPRDAGQEVQHRVGVAEALEQAQALAQQRVVDAEDLHHAARPADALVDVGAEAVGGQARGLRNAQVGRVPAVAVQAQRGVRILGDGLGGEAADIVDRRAPQHRARTAEERRVPQVVAVLHQAVEQLALVGVAAEHAQVALERVRREEVVRGLYQRQLRIAQEPAGGDLQERTHRQVVAVEDRHQLAVELGQRMVEVAGLGVAVVAAGDVVDPGLGGERAELRAPAVIEQVDAQLVRRPVQAQRRIHGVPHQRQFLVVGGDQHVHGRPVARIGRQRRRLALQRPRHLHVAQHQHQPRIGLGREQDHAAGQVEIVVPVERGGVAPPQVAA